jgi:enediyne biosynthesis protein CalE2
VTAANGFVRLDGGVATELERAGLAVASPWWTTAALVTEDGRSVLRRVHGDFLDAGAQVLTANTFRCNLRALRPLGLDKAGFCWMVQAAVGVAAAARNAAGAGSTVVAGSIAPVEDCYRPELTPPDAELRAEHGWLATELVRAGADLILIETMNTIREARIALEAAQAAGARAWVSFVCTSGGRLLSGEPVAEAAVAVEADGAAAVLVNCTGIAETEECLRRMSDVCRGPIGAYPNLEDRARPRENGAFASSVSPADFAATLRRWHDELGATLLGGCCGTTAAHIRALDSLADRA